MKTGIASFLMLAMAPLGAFAQSMPNSTLEFLDANDDIQVSREEISERMDLLFEPMDANGNGRLEFPEVEEFMTREIFDDTDQNGNGSITKSEYREQVLEDFDAADTDGNGVLN